MEAIEYSKGVFSKIYALGITIASEKNLEKDGSEIREVVGDWLKSRGAKAKNIQFTIQTPARTHASILDFIKLTLQKYSESDPAIKNVQISAIFVDEEDREKELNIALNEDTG